MHQKKPDWKLAALVAVLCAFIPLVSLAEEPTTQESDGPPELRTVIKQTKYISVHELEKILSMLQVQVRLKPDINAVVLRSRSSSEIDTALKLIESLDVPPEPGRTVEVTAYVIGAAKQGAGDTGIGEQLTAAVDQMRALFGYSSFELLDSVFLRVRDGRPGQVAGGLLLDEGPDRSSTGYQLAFRRADIIPGADGERMVRLDGLAFEVEASSESDSQAVYFKTDVEVRVGQKAVVGKSTPRGADETLILILEARVLD